LSEWPSNKDIQPADKLLFAAEHSSRQAIKLQ
jgi:hypothetical protein